MDLKKTLDTLRDRVSRLKGKRESLLERLRTEFDCETPEDAQAKLTELRTQHAQEEKKFNDERNKFMELYGDKLEALTR